MNRCAQRLEIPAWIWLRSRRERQGWGNRGLVRLVGERFCGATSLARTFRFRFPGASAFFLIDHFVNDQGKIRSSPLGNGSKADSHSTPTIAPLGDSAEAEIHPTYSKKNLDAGRSSRNKVLTDLEPATLIAQLSEARIDRHAAADQKQGRRGLNLRSPMISTLLIGGSTVTRLSRNFHACTPVRSPLL
jgi:hypothetical protein